MSHIIWLIIELVLALSGGALVLGHAAASRYLWLIAVVILFVILCSFSAGIHAGDVFR